MATYLAVSSFVFLAWGIAWSKKGIFNLLVKISFFGFGFWGFVLALNAYGYILHK